MMKRQSNSLLSKQQLWVLAIGGLFLVDFVLYGYLPSHERLQSLTKAKTQRMQMIATAEAQSQMLPALVERLKQTEQCVANYDRWIPTEDSRGQFLGQITHIMAKNSLSDQDVVFGAETASGDVMCIPVHMKCAGSLEGIFGFFNDLRDLGRLVRIERTTLANSKGLTGALVMEADAMIFYRAEKKQEADKAVSGTSVEVADNEA